MRWRDAKVGAVRSLGVFASCTSTDLKAVCRLMEWAELGRGTVLSTAGQRAEQFCLVVSGGLAGTRPDGVVAPLRPGDHIGAMELIDGGTSSMTVRVVEDAVVLLAARKQFDALLAEVEPFRRAILVGLARDARAARSLRWAPRPVATLAFN